jgi:signal transduction histidine kinase
LLEGADGNGRPDDLRYACIRVADDGPGVPPTVMPRLGERRFRSDEARSRRPTGTGLGLSIARDVAERHGLTLSFEHGDAETHRGLVAVLEGPL